MSGPPNPSTPTDRRDEPVRKFGTLGDLRPGHLVERRTAALVCPVAPAPTRIAPITVCTSCSLGSSRATPAAARRARRRREWAETRCFDLKAGRLNRLPTTLGTQCAVYLKTNQAHIHHSSALLGSHVKMYYYGLPSSRVVMTVLNVKGRLGEDRNGMSPYVTK